MNPLFPLPTIAHVTGTLALWSFIIISSCICCRSLPSSLSLFVIFSLYINTLLSPTLWYNGCPTPIHFKYFLTADRGPFNWISTTQFPGRKAFCSGFAITCSLLNPRMGRRLVRLIQGIIRETEWKKWGFYSVCWMQGALWILVRWIRGELVKKNSTSPYHGRQEWW